MLDYLVLSWVDYCVLDTQEVRPNAPPGLRRACGTVYPPAASRAPGEVSCPVFPQNDERQVVRYQERRNPEGRYPRYPISRAHVGGRLVNVSQRDRHEQVQRSEDVE